MTGLLYIQLGGGLIWLLLGGDFLVRGSVALARRFHVSPMIVAFTVVAFGTSLPELVVVLRASLTGYPGLAIGNVVGSNIANVLLVAGAAAIVHPLTCTEGTVRRDSLVMIGVSVLFVAFCATGYLSALEGAILLGVLAVIAAVTAHQAARSYLDAPISTPIEWVLGLPSAVWTILVLIVFGAIGLPLGARLVVDAAVQISEQLGVSDTIVGLTILAVSTSLPELATTVVAAARGRTEVAVGAVIGSNLFNIAGIMGVAALVSPTAVPVPRGFLYLDFPVMLGAAVVLTAFVCLRRPIGRVVGVILLAAYAAYVMALVFGPSGQAY